MAITKGKKIEYKDLIDQVKNKIRSVCQNVGSFSSAVPANMKHGTENYSVSGSNGQTFKIKVNDALMNPSNAVPLEDSNPNNHNTVMWQLTNFLSSRGIDIKSDKVITARDLLNFYQNIAIFIDSKIVQVKSLFNDNTTLIFYDLNGNPMSAANIGTDNPGAQITTTNMYNLLSTLETTLSNVSRVHIVKQNWEVACSCSSSSSSSCSSSSSLFIAYMRI